MDVHPSSMVPSTSKEPSSLDSQRFGRVCSQRYCGTSLWAGSTSDICDRCLAEREACSALRNPKDATRAYAKAACSAPLRYSVPSSSPYLLPSSRLESTQDGIDSLSKQQGHSLTSVSNQGRRSANPLSSTINVPLCSHNDLRHKSNVHSLAEEQTRAHLQLCGVCRAVIYTGTVCPHCRSDAAPIKEETGFNRCDCLSEPKDIVAKSDLEDGDDGLSAAVMSIILNPDENLDDTDDMDMEGIELSYPEFMDNGTVEEPKLQPAEEDVSCLKELEGNLPPEKKPRYPNQGVPDLAPTFPNRKEALKNTLRSLKLCSMMGCTGTISRESLATRCLECVRRDWKSKTSKGHTGHRADDGRLSSETIERSISTKQETKKAVTWADEVSYSPAFQQSLECTPTIKQLKPSNKDIPSSESQEVDPQLPKRETSSHSAATGFKIRIPPRPGLYVQKCSNIRCEQRLPATYRWKLCMMCRARSREYQRKRQNLQGRPSRPEEGVIPSSSYLMNDCTSEQSLLEPKAKSIPVHSSLALSPYPQYKAIPNLLADFKVRFNDFLHAQSIFFFYNEADSRFNLAKAVFMFEAEYSIVALDFDILGEKDAIDANVLKLKREIERMGRIQFSPKRYISILEGGGIAERFLCLKQAPVLMTVSDGQDMSAATYMKNMRGELEIAVVPDHSHPFLAGHRTIVRFRLLG